MESGGNHYEKILFATSEAVPFIKTGGLADVAGSLPKFFDKEKYDVRVMLPKYMCMKESWKEKLQYKTHFILDLGWRTQYVGFWRQSMKESPFILSIMNYILMVLHHMERCIQMLRSFHFFSKAVLSALPVIDFRPDIIHCHDWQTGLISDISG